ncbi:hypothetical protein WJ978_24825 [Achromobacter xylosoxidans]
MAAALALGAALTLLLRESMDAGRADDGAITSRDGHLDTNDAATLDDTKGNPARPCKPPMPPRPPARPSRTCACPPAAAGCRCWRCCSPSSAQAGST